MASLKQTKIYGALEVYNGENKVSVTVDSENYPNGIMSIGRINIDGIEMYRVGDELGFTYPISTDGVTTLTISTYDITDLYTLTFAGGNRTISGVHSIEFDGITGSKISNLYDLTLNSNGVINFGSNKISTGSFTGESLTYFKILSNGSAGGVYLGNYAGTTESGVKLKWSNSILNIDKPVTIDNGLSLNKTSISNLGTLSFSSSGTTATLLWSGTALSINQPLSFGDQANHSSVAKDKIEVGAGSDSNGESPKRSTLTSTKIENVYTDSTGTSTVTIENGKILVDEKYDNIVIGADGATFNDTVSAENGSTKKSMSNIAIGTSSTVSMKGDNGIFIGSGNSVVDASEDNNYPGIGIGFRPDIHGGIGIGQYTKAGMNAIAIGNSAEVALVADLPLGGQQVSYVSNGIAIGTGAHCTVSNGIALGTSASCANTTRLVIPSSWTFHSGNGNALTSDRLEKTAIKSLNGKYTNFLMDLNPVSYRFNYREDYAIENPNPKYRDKYGIPEYDKEEHSKATKAHKRTHVGFIAQDVKAALEKHFPNNDHLDIVSIDKMDTGEFQKGEVDPGYERYYMNYTAMIPVLVKVLQEQQEEINYLKSEIEKLKKIRR